MEQETKEMHDKQYFRIIFIFSIILIALFGIFYFLISDKITSTVKDINNNDIPVFDQNVQETEIEYVLKEYNGKIGIFENEALIYTLDTYVFTLPENDKKLLSEGIVVSTQEELYELLEQYY